ncbi:tRNA (N6-isopentenyl adenosine(37)-C2)-methylthiotransferase MiaB [Rickettsia endosymbiont of Halotydeus destructor]|uniref:tRNA (N6-isopentenyl adenosine(37)-C2)-methylthiotransferase MiaB n=1 Tax=Rickettsia endosymbiont of Halotydeus destructor TaxID=2996754 RepID=UPI003BB03E7D
MSKKLFIKTYGCQMNVYDSIKMQDLLYPFGYEATEIMTDADIIILNTCHIREKAAEKTYSELGRIKKLQDQRKSQGLNSAIIVVAGCVAQAEGEEIFQRTPYVDIVVGPQSYYNLPELIAKVVRHEKHLINLDFVKETKFDNLPEQLYPQGASAFISVQEGCDKFCTFCVVPYTRGAEFSRNLEQIYRESLKVVSSGAKEITLLGQNVNAYHGKDPEDKVCSLADLIKHLAQIPNLERIRYTTSHPIDMSDDLIKLHGIEPKLMPFLHLPVQSGSNKILKAMNRKHDRDYYFDIINRLRAARPDIVLSSDFIVGFPGETDEDFTDTLDLIRRVGYGQCYSFKYSPRPGTPGALKKDQIPENIKSERLGILQKELSKQQLAFNESCVGRVMEVLFDRSGKFDDQIIGKTPYMQSVYIQNPNKDLLGKIIDVKITKAASNSLAGEVV